MKWEDTVISWERIRMVLQEQHKKGVTDNMFTLEAIAKAQAEISFPLGKQEGIKEVVEFQKQHPRWYIVHQGIERDGITEFNPARDHCLWQAKLKEWSIKEDKIMITYHCDKCGKEADELSSLEVDGKWKEICEDCKKEYHKLWNQHQKEWQQKVKKWFEGGQGNGYNKNL